MRKQRDTRWLRGLALAAGLAATLGMGTARAQNGPADASPNSPHDLRRGWAPGQGFQFGGRFAGWGGAQPAPGGPGNASAPYLPFGVQETYPLAPTDNPDILRLLLQMRATSPNPNQFMGGTLNPQYVSTIGPQYPRSRHTFRGGLHSNRPYFYGGYVDPYATGGYGTVGGLVVGAPIVPSVYSVYGSWYPQYLPENRVIVQREIIYVPSHVREQAPPPSESDLKPEIRNQNSEETSNGYYLTKPHSESLDDAVAEIRHAWLNGDYTRFRARVMDEGKVRIYLKGKYEYSVKSDDFAQMTRDAMTRIDTTAFELDHVTKLGDDRAFASGKHTYLDPDKNKHEVYISYVLERTSGHWKIAEAGSSTTAVTKHED